MQLVPISFSRNIFKVKITAICKQFEKKNYYLLNSSPLLDEFLFGIKLTIEVSTVAVTPVCERLHSSFEMLGRGS